MPYQVPGSVAAQEQAPATADSVLDGTAAAITEAARQLTTPQTASEGAHPLQVTEEEGLFACDQKEMISKLQKLLKLKYGAVIMYMNYGDKVLAHFRDSIYAHFQEHMKEEISHCYDLAMKITALGGEAPPKVGQVAEVGGLHQTFIAVIQQEKELLKAARDVLARAGENTGLKVLIENMVLTDQRHADDARRMLLCEE